MAFVWDLYIWANMWMEGEVCILPFCSCSIFRDTLKRIMNTEPLEYKKLVA